MIELNGLDDAFIEAFLFKSSGREGLSVTLLYLGVFLLTLSLLKLLIWPATRMGWVDKPTTRKHHPYPVPVVGGLALWAAFLAGSLLVCSLSTCWLLLVSMSGVMLVGFYDDIHHAHPHHRLGLQFGIALLLLLNPETQLSQLGNLLGLGGIETGWFAWVLTPLAVTGLINAFNMMDGLDGLSAGLALVAVGLMLINGLNGLAPVTAMMGLLGVLAAALCGFLVYNLRYPGHPRASVFMGDAGSNLLGFLLAWFLIRLSQPGAGVLDPVTALWIVALPLMDTIAVMVRRWRQGLSPFAADRQHLHHLLLGRGFTDGQVVAMMLALGVSLGLTGILLQRLALPEYLRFYAFLLLFAMYYRVTYRMNDSRVTPRSTFERRAESTET